MRCATALEVNMQQLLSGFEDQYNEGGLAPNSRWWSEVKELMEYYSISKELALWVKGYTTSEWPMGCEMGVLPARHTNHANISKYLNTVYQ